MRDILVQLVTLGTVVFGHDDEFFCVQPAAVVTTVFVDFKVMWTVRGGGWQTVVFSGQRLVVTLWLVLPGHLTQGSVSVVVLVLCWVMTLVEEHCEIEADLVELVLSVLVFLVELVFFMELVFEELDLPGEVLRRAELVEVPLRKGAELDETTARDDDNASVRRGTELERMVEVDSGLGRGDSSVAELEEFRKGPSVDWLGRATEPDGAGEDETPLLRGPVLEVDRIAGAEDTEDVDSAGAEDVVSLRKGAELVSGRGTIPVDAA